MEIPIHLHIDINYWPFKIFLKMNILNIYFTKSYDIYIYINIHVNNIIINTLFLFLPFSDLNTYTHNIID